MKKLLAIVFTLLLVFVLCSTAAAEEDIIASGDCGSSGTTSYDVYWKLTGDGTLTIYGEGIMEYYFYTDRPWHVYTDQIQKVVVEEGITSISSFAFTECPALTSVSLPGSLTSLGASAFAYCTALEEITLPSSLTDINNDAFKGCSKLLTVHAPSLADWLELTFTNEYSNPMCNGGRLLLGGTPVTSVVLPNTLTVVPAYCFQNCATLTSVSYPSGLTGVGAYAFTGCTGLTSIDLPDTITSYGLCAYKGCTGVKNLTVSAAMLNSGVGFGSFYPTTVESVIIADGVTTIPANAFKNCDGIVNITIPGSVTRIESYAFTGCYALSNVYAGTVAQWLGIEFTDNASNPGYYGATLYLAGKPVGDLVVPNGITKINSLAFINNKTLTSISLPASLHSIGENAFLNCTRLVSVTVRGKCTTAGTLGFGAFNGCTLLESVQLPNSITTIDNVAFSDCSSLTNITFPEKLSVINDYVFSDCASLSEVTLPKSVTSVGAGAFEYCDQLTSFTFTNSATTLGYHVFSDCPALTAITLPSQPVDGTNTMLTYLGDVLDQLTHITVVDGVTTIASNTFQSCTALTCLSLPNSLTSVATNAINACPALTELTVPGCMIAGRDSASGVTLSDYTNVDLLRIRIADGVTRLGSNALTGFFDGSSGNSYSLELPDTLTTIGNYALGSCCYLLGVELPASVTQIGDGAFTGCSRLVIIGIPSLNDWLEITFTDASANPLSLTGAGLQIDGEYVYDIVIPNGTTAIKPYAFYGYSRMTSLQVPEGVASIGESAFSGCNKLKSISLPESLTTIGAYAFNWCSGNSRVFISENVTAIGDGAFANSGKLDVVIPASSMPSLGTDVFSSTIPTVYCYAYSDADYWAAGESYSIVYLNETGLPLSLALPEDTSMFVGETLQVVATIFPADPDAAITWKSSSPDVVAASGGKLTAKGAGTATITATCGSCSDSMVITTKLKLTGFTLADQWLVAKETLKLVPANLQPVGISPTFSWSSSDTTVVQVSSAGVVTAVKPGTATITAKADGISRSCTITVCNPVTAVSFPQSSLTLYVDCAQQLTATVTTRTATYTNKLVTFTSSNTGVATVDANGLVVITAPGTATITATAASGCKASCTITARTCTTVTLPSSLKTITENSLANIGAQAVVIPYGCTTIAAGAFANNEKLMLVYMPDSITSIAETAFSGCPNVQFLCTSNNAAAHFAQANGIPFRVK